MGIPCFVGAEKRIRTSGTFQAHTRFPIVLLKPLRHLCIFKTLLTKRLIILLYFFEKCKRFYFTFKKIFKLFQKFFHFACFLWVKLFIRACSSCRQRRWVKIPYPNISRNKIAELIALRQCPCLPKSLCVRLTKRIFLPKAWAGF